MAGFINTCNMPSRFKKVGDLLVSIAAINFSIKTLRNMKQHL
jgi:hypothetical protein